MKLKLSSMLAGLLAATAIAVTPLAAFAQQQAPQPQQARTRIVLSEEQQTQFEQLQANAIAQIEAALTPEQKTQFAAGRENGEGLRAVENLSDEQITEIRAAVEAFNTQVGNILTAEQKQQIEQGQPSQ